MLEQVAQALEGHFATVLWGPPGVGKSRIAHAAAARWFDDRADGDVWVVDLSATDDEASALALVAATIVDGSPPDRALEEFVGSMLARARPSLLVLDHAEHLADAVAGWLAGWEPGGRGRVLVTSRVALDVGHTFEVPALTEDEALRLIEQGARRVRASFSVDGASRDLRELVRRVDGLPGALELLGPRLMLLPPRQLLERMERGPGALHAAIERSWELLDQSQQQALLQLAVVRHTFDLELAERVVDCGRDVLDVLEDLTRHAWIHVVDGDLVAMHLLHEPRRFLRARGVDEDAAARFVAAMVELGERWDAGIETADEVECTRRLIESVPNLWAAREAAAGEDRARLDLVLHMALQRAGGADRQDEITAEAVGLAQDDALRARAMLARGRVLRWLGRVTESRTLLEAAGSLGDAGTRCSALRNLAAGAYAAGDLEQARRWADEALREALDEGDGTDEINARNGLGFLLSATGDLVGAEEQLRRAAELASAPEQAAGLYALVASSRAGLALRAGRSLDAELYSTQAIEAYERLGYVRQLPLELLYRAEARLSAGRLDAADDDIAVADTIARRWVHDSLILRALYLRGVAAIARRDAVCAADVLGRAATRLAAQDNPRLAVEVGFATAAARVLAGDGVLALEHLRADDADAAWLRAYVAGAAPAHHSARDPLRQVCIDALLARGATLTVDPDGRGFQWSDGEHVDLTRRKALRGILAALADRHGGGELTLDELLDAGWPGEKMTVESGNRRVYVTVNRLRELGLGDALCTVGDGYMLDPRVVVVRG